MTGPRMRPAFVVGFLLGLLAIGLQGVRSEEESEPIPSEDLCRPYIEKALKDLGTGSLEQTSAEVGIEVDQESDEEALTASEETGEPTDDVSIEEGAEADTDESKEATEEQVDVSEDKTEEEEKKDDEQSEELRTAESAEEDTEEAKDVSDTTEDDKEQDDSEKQIESGEYSDQIKTEEDEKSDEEKSDEEVKAESEKSEEDNVDKDEKSDEEKDEIEDSSAKDDEQSESRETTEQIEAESVEEADEEETTADKSEDGAESIEDQTVSHEDEEVERGSKEDAETATSVEEDVKSEEETVSKSVEEEEGKSEEEKAELTEEQEQFTKKEAEEVEGEKSVEEETSDEETKCEKDDIACKESAKQEDQDEDEGKSEEGKSEEETARSEEEDDGDVKSRGRREVDQERSEEAGETTEEDVASSEEEQELTPEEDLIQEIEIPENLRPRDHINQLLKLDEENEEEERAIQREADIILRDLKRLYDNAIQPLESMYKYRDLSNRHFGDPEIFSKPLVLFMGPWSGGKSSIINYLLDIEYKPMSLRTGGLRECLEEHCKSPNGNDTGAEPSPAYFNIIMHGEEEEVLDGTQLAADWTFSGLQKFGQGMLDRLRGLRFNNKLLEKVNIVEIPGILEIRKQVQRLFPFNDACQWFIDRADIIFLVYDPAKLDVGPETEAILDQLKGREYQTRIILNKADQVKPEELMRVQGALIWNISPLMSSAEPPIMYSASLWSLPYEAGAPIRLLYAQERAFLRDLRSAINKRVEHKIASARRFAVRVRNHAKMVDCYLTTYYNHKTFFGNKKEMSDKIIENPQDYHIYEGLSTLTNISRYDLPDPDVYRDFFRLNPLYDFQLLSSTCTYFRGCPINRLDVAIAYDLPELVGKYKKSVEAVLHKNEGNSPPS